MKLVIFEDGGARDFYPLTELHAVYDLRLGLHTQSRRLQLYLGMPAAGYLTRRELAAVMAEEGYPQGLPKGDDSLFLVNARLWDCNWQRLRKLAPGESAALEDGTPVALHLDPEKAALPELDAEGLPLFPQKPTYTVPGKVLTYPWDLTAANAAALVADSTHLTPLNKEFAAPGVTILNPERVFLGPDVQIHPQVVLDAREGPVVLEKGAVIEPFTVLQGPVAVGAHSRVKPHSHIYDAASIGPHCKVCGEIENSILHSYVNKQHQGFLGHALLMPWTNLGADTNNSDLKNNYGPVRVSQRGVVRDSGTMFLGLIMGDHAKSAINTQFNTGTVVGVGANIFRSGFPPKEIRPFSWGGHDGAPLYQLEKALGVAGRVMARRDRKLTSAQKELLTAIWRRTAAEEQA